MSRETGKASDQGEVELAPAADLDELGLSAEGLEHLFRTAADQLPRAGPCACQVAVARWGRLAGFRTVGHALFEGEGGEATNRSLFHQFSVTKALFSSATWILLQEGGLELDEPVARRFPEFAANGKGEVTLEQLMLHTSGFPTAEMDPLVWLDPEARVATMAGWELEWKPGTQFVYHGTSSMWVVAELMERSTGRDFRDFFRERVIEPLGLSEMYLGLPAHENARVADMVPIGDAVSESRKLSSGMSVVEVPDEEYARFNTPELRAVGTPSGGLIATAANVALFYQALLADAAGSTAAPGLWKSDMLREAWRDRTGELTDPMTQKPAVRGLGVVLADGSKATDKIFRGFPAKCSPQTFGHMGAGGQIAWADPVSGLSFAYCTNAANRDPVSQGAQGLQLSAQAAACIRK